MKAEEFLQQHFPGIEKETWYPAIVALAEGYSKQFAIEQLQELKYNYITTTASTTRCIDEQINKLKNERS